MKVTLSSFSLLACFIEDNEGWTNKRKCKPKKPIELTISPNAFVCTTLVNQEKTSAAYDLAFFLGLS